MENVSYVLNVSKDGMTPYSTASWSDISFEFSQNSEANASEFWKNPKEICYYA